MATERCKPEPILKAEVLRLLYQALRNDKALAEQFFGAANEGRERALRFAIKLVRRMEARWTTDKQRIAKEEK